MPEVLEPLRMKRGCCTHTCPDVQRHGSSIRATRIRAAAQALTGHSHLLFAQPLQQQLLQQRPALATGFGVYEHQDWAFWRPIHVLMFRRAILRVHSGVRVLQEPYRDAACTNASQSPKGCSRCCVRMPPGAAARLARRPPAGKACTCGKSTGRASYRDGQPERCVILHVDKRFRKGRWRSLIFVAVLHCAGAGPPILQLARGHAAINRPH